MGAQMELSYLDNNNYSGINPDNGEVLYPNTTCQGQISNMVSSIVNQGAIVRCLSLNRADTSDIYQRWGVTALLSGTNTPFEAYSASETGVVKWDTQGVNTTGTFVTTDVTMNWSNANNACMLSGGRLPIVEELRTLHDAHYLASESTTHNPPGFNNGIYWSSITNPSDSTKAYGVGFTLGGVTSVSKSSGYYVRCVR